MPLKSALLCYNAREMLKRGRFGALVVCVGGIAGVALLSAVPACGGKAVGVETDDGTGGSSTAGFGNGKPAPVGNQPGPSKGVVVDGPEFPPAAGGMLGGSVGGSTHSGRAGTGSAGSPVVTPGAGGSVEEGSCNVGGASPVCDFGLPCTDDSDCGAHDCYVPGGQGNPICSKLCATSADCPLGSACTGPFGDGSHCFVLCSHAAQCLAINDTPENPLDCVNMHDPRAPQGQTVCAQYSEP